MGIPVRAKFLHFELPPRTLMPPQRIARGCPVSFCPQYLAKSIGAVCGGIVETILNLLTREGACYMAFQPSLSAGQYAELLVAVKKASTRQGMNRVIKAFAKRHKLAYSLDPAKAPK